MLCHRGICLLVMQDTLMKHIVSFLNRGVLDHSLNEEGRLLIGVGKDKQSSLPVVMGVRASQKKSDQLVVAINEGLNGLRVNPK